MDMYQQHKVTYHLLVESGKFNFVWGENSLSIVCYHIRMTCNQKQSIL